MPPNMRSAARIGGLTTDIGAATAAGQVGAANAQAQGIQGLGQAVQTGLLGAGTGFGGGNQVDTSGSIRTTNPFTPPPPRQVNPFTGQ